jgi:hypothetical protein
VIAAGVLLAAFVLHALWLRAVVDDAFITFRYARHLADGHGFVWNVGDTPVEGFTSLLWLLLGALATRLGLDVVLVSQALGLAAAVGTFVFVFWCARRRFCLSVDSALVPCIVLACMGPFATWALSGMETSLFTFLVLAVVFHVTGGSDLGIGRTRALGVAALLFLATLTRPEGLGVFALVVLGLVLAGRRRGLDTLVLAYALPFLLLVAWRWTTFGELVPNTFHAKTGLSPWVPVRGLLYTLYFLAFYVAPWLPLWLLHSKEPFPRVPGQRGDASIGLVMLAGWTLYVVLVGGDYMAMDRFFVPVLPLVALVIGRRAALLIGGRARTDQLISPVLAAFAFGALVTLLHSTPLDVAIFGRPQAQAGNYAGIQNERYAVSRFSAVGRWLDGYRRDAREEFAAKVIGAIGWHADVRVLDMLGLTDAHIAHATPKAKPLGLGYPGHERSDLAYVAARRPTYVLLEIADAPHRVSHPDWGDAQTNALLVREYVVQEATIPGPSSDSLCVVFLERAESAARR